MEKIKSSASKLPGIVYSRYADVTYAGENFIEEHGLAYIISGCISVPEGNKIDTFKKGDLIFYRKNYLAKFIKQPTEGESCKTITIVFDEETLSDFSREHHYECSKVYSPDEAVLCLEPNVLLLNFFKTLIPYFDVQVSDQLIRLKKQEALMLLLEEKPGLKEILFDFSHPGKIDLEAFMNRNFKFNVELKRLAYLTGRSLATFKRDFEKIFNMSPNRWLQQRRLQEAYYLIKEKSRKPSDVYIELGFHSISHFSYAFKQFFGVNASSI